jgi:hypothetical protein
MHFDLRMLNLMGPLYRQFDRDSCCLDKAKSAGSFAHYDTQRMLQIRGYSSKDLAPLVSRCVK